MKNEKNIVNSEDNQKEKNNKKTESSTVKQLKEIYETMKSAKLSEVEIKSATDKIKIKRYTKKEEQKLDFDHALITQQNVPQKVETEKISGEEIVSPINGVFYRAASPNSPPLVNEGDIVNQGTTLCIIEAMKVMNEIKAEKKCKIIKILCENGEAVNTGTKMFIIQPV